MMKRGVLFLLLSVSSLAQAAKPFTVTSSDVRTGKEMAAPFLQNGSGCTGQDKSPQLSWSGEPAGTRSFAVTVYDPDAPTGSGWWHWTLVNIPASVHSLATDAGNRSGKNIPAGAVQGNTDFGQPGYGGACPPPGDKTHHYHVKVWALDTETLPVDGHSTGALTGFLLNSHKLAEAELVPNSTR